MVFMQRIWSLEFRNIYFIFLKKCIVLLININYITYKNTAYISYLHHLFVLLILLTKTLLLSVATLC